MGSERLNGAVITRLVNKPGASYESVATDIGVSPSTVRQMEKGYLPRKRRDEILDRLSRAAKVSVAALMIAPKAA